MSAESHPDYQAHLRAVLAQPADDLPRLIMADWLDEHSCPERAEFVRVGCKAEGMLVPQGRLEMNAQYTLVITRQQHPSGIDQWVRIADWEAYHALRRRERELLEPDRSNWCWRADRIPILVERSQFRRGFVEAVTCRWADWRTHAAAVLACQPVTRVRLVGGRPRLNDNRQFFSSRRYQLDGCDRWHPACNCTVYRKELDEFGPADAMLLAVLRAEYGPGMTFELPAAGGV